MFKDDKYVFYFDVSVKDELKSSMHKVFMNSGAILAKLDVIAKKEYNPKGVYCIVPDGRPEVSSKIKQEIGDIALLLSPRWIDYCIERNSVIKDVKTRGMVNLLPFDLITPLPSLKDYKVAIFKEHFDLDRAASLEAMVSILGFNTVSSLSKE